MKVDEIPINSGLAPRSLSLCSSLSAPDFSLSGSQTAALGPELHLYALVVGAIIEMEGRVDGLSALQCRVGDVTGFSEKQPSKGPTLQDLAESSEPVLLISDFACAIQSVLYPSETHLLIRHCTDYLYLTYSGN